MAIKNYYAILGVSPDETPSGIRAAYRDAVRRTHPDFAGPESAAAFEDIVEAHSVLSDPDKRRTYNRSLGLPLQNPTGPVSPDRVEKSWEPASIFADLDSAHLPFETLAAQLLRNFTGPVLNKRRRAFAVEVILTPEEAARGGIISIDIPLRELCSTCGGTGNDWLFPCMDCKGSGSVSTLQPVRIRIPRALSLGVLSDVSLEILGGDGVFPSIRLRVSRPPWPY